MGLHSVVNLKEHIAISSGLYIVFADIFHFGPNIHHDLGRWNFSPPQNMFRPFVGRAATSRNGVWTARLLQKIRIGDGGTNGIGVRIAMAKNKYAHRDFAVEAGGD